MHAHAATSIKKSKTTPRLSTDPRGRATKVRHSAVGVAQHRPSRWHREGPAQPGTSRLNEPELVLLVLALTHYKLQQIATVANTTTHTAAAAATTANTAVIDASAAVGPNIHKHTHPEAHPSTGPPTHFPAHHLPIYDTTTAFHHNHRHQQNYSYHRHHRHRYFDNSFGFGCYCWCGSC